MSQIQLGKFNPEHFPDEEELLEALRWEKMQARLSGESDIIPDFLYEYHRHRLGLSDTAGLHYVNKPRQCGKSSALRELHKMSGWKSWLVYPKTAAAHIYWGKKDLHLDNVGVIGDPNLMHRIAAQRPVDVILFDEPMWMDERRLLEFMDYSRAAHGKRMFMYGSGTSHS